MRCVVAMSFLPAKRLIRSMCCGSHSAKVLMYCTGGIRCEKASAMLRDHGVDDVAQLRGGIHRYLEHYPDGGFFLGKNFVFDKRRAMGPTLPRSGDGGGAVLGVCGGCGDAYDELHGGRVCTVCRDLVLACPKCRPAELHCIQHSHLKSCFFTFIDHFQVGDEHHPLFIHAISFLT